jgi:signal peptidase II
LNRHLKDYGLLLGVAAIIVAVDQWTKYLVQTYIPFTGVWAPWDWLLPYARIVHWKNTGAAFGMLQGYGLVFTALAVVVSGLIIYYFPRLSPSDWPLRAALCLQLGGALGNLVDRLTKGGQVTDFISVGNFAVFNVADACISVGVVVLLIGFWIKDSQQKKTAVPVSSDATSVDQGAEGDQGG